MGVGIQELGENIADIEVCMLYKGKGPRNLPQNQCFIMLISFGLRVVARIVAKRLTSHAENNLLIVQEQYGFRSKHSVLGPVLVLTLCIEDAVKIKFNPECDSFACVLQTFPRHTECSKTRVDGCVKKSGIPPKLLNIIRGLMEHARYRVKSNGGHDDKWFHMSLGLKEGCPAVPIEFSIYHSFIMKELNARMMENQEESIRVGFGTEEFNDLRSFEKMRRQRKSGGQEKSSKHRSPSTSSCSQTIQRVYAGGQICRTAKSSERDLQELEAHLEMGAHHRGE